MKKGKSKLQDLFVICNVPPSFQFQLICRFLMREDVDMYGYFSQKLADKYNFPADFQVAEGFYDRCRYSTSYIEGGTLIDGFHFGTFNCYEAAVDAANSYTPDTLLAKFFEIYDETMRLAHQ